MVTRIPEIPPRQVGEAYRAVDPAGEKVHNRKREESGKKPADDPETATGDITLVSLAALKMMLNGTPPLAEGQERIKLLELIDALEKKGVEHVPIALDESIRVALDRALG